MTKTLKERIINALIALAIAVIALFVCLRISFEYTRKYHNANMNLDYKILMDKLDRIIKNQTIMIQEFDNDTICD